MTEAQQRKTLVAFQPAINNRRRLKQTTLPAYEGFDGLIVHQSTCGKRNHWTVAHKGTGMGIVYDLPKRKARMIASVLAALPVQWQTKTQDEFFKVWRGVPQWVDRLVTEIRHSSNRQCVSGPNVVE